MPIYMDRHYVEGATAHALAVAHTADLAGQNRYRVRFLTYWFDEVRSTAFCLVDSPDKETIRQAHHEWHGLVVHEIIEVDPAVVEAFLGRVGDPTAADPLHLEQAIDAAFRAIMFTDLKDSTLMTSTLGDARALHLLHVSNVLTRNALRTYRGREIKHTGDGVMASFAAVSDAVTCAVSVQEAVVEHGIGDLKVVKEKLLRYVAGEVAHIENVLDGEKKDRTHRRLDRTEETLTIETELIEETEKDNQTTDRFEMKKETEKTIQTDLSVDAGVTVSASYGPVELGAYANFAYSQSSTETVRSAQNFARDIVDRSLTKIQKRAREERVTKTLKEIEETNLHGIDNSPAGNGHVTGIYRWVDKEYEAQVYNYGERMMFEFVLPEPAAYHYYAQENDPGNKIQVEQPRELGLLTHKDAQPWNFGEYVRAYNVQGVTPPPPEWKVLTATFDQNGMSEDQATSKSSKDLVVPDGYLAKSFGWHWRTWECRARTSTSSSGWMRSPALTATSPTRTRWCRSA